ncbi:MAG TPA: winged helix-turn-helix domain-containing protein [Mycobacteriales bacterium]|nr:winged helix-turn-helix domain-containing protein [Mycobacteriales bacterium]
MTAAAPFLARAADEGLVIEGSVHSGDLEVDLTEYEVRLSGTPLEMSPRQVELLALFLAAPGRVWSRQQLHWICWEDTSPSRRVDVQLCRIRAKVGMELFRNVRDRGWALRVPLPAARAS